MSIFRFPPLVWLGIGILIISLGIRQSFGIFMMPISDTFQSGREFFSLAIAVQNLLLVHSNLSLAWQQTDLALNVLSPSAVLRMHWLVPDIHRHRQQHSLSLYGYVGGFWP